MRLDIIEGLFLTLQTWGPSWRKGFLLSLRSPPGEWSTILLPHPPSAGKEVQEATVGGLGRGPYTAGALRENIREIDADANCSLMDPPYGKWQSLG